jgi:hypothetical protein
MAEVGKELSAHAQDPARAGSELRARRFATLAMQAVHP